MVPALGLFDLQVPAKDVSASWGWECNVQGTVSEKEALQPRSPPVSGPQASCKSGPKKRKYSSQHLQESKQNVFNFLMHFNLALLVVWCWHKACFYKETLFKKIVITLS